MPGTSPVGSYGVTLSTGPGAMTPTVWFAQADADFAVLMRAGDNFAPRPLGSPGMGVQIDAGFVQAVLPTGQQVITEVAIQTVSLLAAPGAPNTRIDLICADAATGIASAVSGTPATTPAAPTLPPGKVSLALVAVPSGTTAIGSSNINDRRTAWGNLVPQMPWAIGGGTGSAITAAYTPATLVLSDGLLLSVRSPGANTSPTPTFSPDGLGATAITKMGGQQLASGDIPGQYAEILLRYNLAHTRWELLNPAPQDAAAVTAAAAAQSAAASATSTANTAATAAVTAQSSANSAISTANSANTAASNAASGLTALQKTVSDLSATVQSMQSQYSSGGNGNSNQS